jgi:transcriptional regulator with XRE-family HTH domain
METKLNKKTDEKQSTAPARVKSGLAQFMARQIEAISHLKSVEEIAREVGYEKPMMILLYASGEAHTPLEKLPALAKALDVHFSELFRLAMRDYFPRAADAIDEIIVRPSVRSGTLSRGSTS